MVTGRGGYSLLFASYKRNSAKLCFQTQTCFASYFSKDGLSGVDICFGHMRDISLMLLELRERHLEGWRGPSCTERCIVVVTKLNACDQAAYAYAF